MLARWRVALEEAKRFHEKDDGHAERSPVAFPKLAGYRVNFR